MTEGNITALIVCTGILLMILSIVGGMLASQWMNKQ